MIMMQSRSLKVRKTTRQEVEGLALYFFLRADIKHSTASNTHPLYVTLFSWVETLLAYNFTLIHVAGLNNVLPDCLSRVYPDEAPTAVILNLQLENLSERRILPEDERIPLLEQVHNLEEHFGRDVLILKIWHKYNCTCKISKRMNVKGCERFQKHNLFTKQGFHSKC
jgi:hypothetical protein